MITRRLHLYLLILICCIPVITVSQIWEAVQLPMTATDVELRANNLVIVGSYSFAQSNDGIDWEITDLSEALNADPGNLMTLGFFDDQSGLLASRDLQGTGPKMISTDDGGITWEFLDPELGPSCFSNFIPFKIHILNDSAAMLQNLNSTMLMTTKNRGKNWSCTNEFVPEPGVWLNISIVSDVEWYIGDLHGHFKTVDGGITYTKLIDKNFAHIQIEGNNAIYAMTYKWGEPSNSPVLYRTTNDWVTYDSTILTQFEDKYIELFTVLSEDEIFVYIKGTETYLSSDGGHNFTFIQDLSNQPFRSAKLGNDRYLSGRGLWKLKSNSIGIADAFINEETIVFPNPTNGHLFFGDKSIEKYAIIRSDGVLVRSGRVKDNGVDLSTLEGGLYFLRSCSATIMFNNVVVKL